MDQFSFEKIKLKIEKKAKLEKLKCKTLGIPEYKSCNVFFKSG